MPKLAVAARRRKVLQLHLQGLTQEQIAACLGLNQASISRHLSAISQEWRASKIRDFDAERARELERINLIEREAWLAYRQSQQPLIVTQAVIADGRETTRRTVTPRHGDTQLLAVIQKCVALRRDLLGLPPAVDSRGSASLPLEPHVFRTRIIARLEELRERERLAREAERTIEIPPGDVRPADEAGEVNSSAVPATPATVTEQSG